MSSYTANIILNIWAHDIKYYIYVINMIYHMVLGFSLLWILVFKYMSYNICIN